MKHSRNNSPKNAAERSLQVPFLKAVLFDIDGTIALTEKRNQDVISQLAFKYGAKITARDWDDLGGQPETVVWAYLAPRYPAFAKAVSAADFMAESRAISMKIAFAVAARPGILESMALFKQKNLRIAAVTNAHRQAAHKSLSDTGSAPFMEFVITEDDVLDAGRAQKPAPDPYLMAAAKMGITPQECLVIEDSAAGVTAAKAAGMTVIQVLDHKTMPHPAADGYARDEKSLLALCRAYTAPKPLL